MLAHCIPVLLRHIPVLLCHIPVLPAQLHLLLNPPPIQFAGIINLWRFCSQVSTSMLLPGKRPGQPLMATSVSDQQPSRLFYVTDSLTGLHFLVDTGAEISVVPPSAWTTNTARTVFIISLQAVNNTPIATWYTTTHFKHWTTL